MKSVLLALTLLTLSVLAGTCVASAAIDQQNTTYTDSPDGSTAIGERCSWVPTNDQWCGQTFTAGLSGPLSRVDVNMFCFNCAPYTVPPIAVTIRATSGGLPTGKDLAATTLTVTNNSGATVWYSANFATPVNVTAGTQYAIVIHPSLSLTQGALGLSDSATKDATGKVTGNDVYRGGTVVVLPHLSSSWSIQTDNSVTSDAAFKTYVGSAGTGGSSADLSISNSDGATTETPGTSVTYTITASNSAGSSSVTGATVTDTFPQGLSACTWTCTGANGGTCPASGSGNINSSVNLPGGASVTFSATCSIAAAATGTLSNTAAISAPAGVTDPNTGNNSATDTDTLAAQADLSISNSDGVASAAPGGSVTYVIKASNLGPSSVSGATVQDTFPPTLTCNWTCAGAAGGACAASGSGSINDATVNLPKGGNVTYSAVCKISSTATGTLNNTATVTAPAGVTDPATGNNTAPDSDSLTVAADVIVTMNDGIATAQVGDVINYVIQVTNAGPSDTSVSVNDALPAQLSNGSWVCSATGGASCAKSSGNNNTMNTSATVPVGGNATYIYTATLSSDNSADSFTNTVSIAPPAGVDPNGANNVVTDTNTIVVFQSRFEADQQTLAMNVASAAGAGDSFTVQMGVDASLLYHLGSKPVTIASGRSTNGKSLFSVQLVRLGSDIAMRTLTSSGDSVFSDVSPWRTVDLKQHVLSLGWQSASERGSDRQLNVAAGNSQMTATGHSLKESVAQLHVAVENNIPWLVPIDP